MIKFVNQYCVDAFHSLYSCSLVFQPQIWKSPTNRSFKFLITKIVDRYDLNSEMSHHRLAISLNHQTPSASSAAFLFILCLSIPHRIGSACYRSGWSRGMCAFASGAAWTLRRNSHRRKLRLTMVVRALVYAFVLFQIVNMEFA